ncbi:hypothetical protein EPUS_05363 [Endocarpon pusillum Z07020]|uniref:Uncharacterized protein n=1 Tax=Endocarpon pusillum (strain Z07020 / HMAS-L-300199) TaxID=1263415 RepID=U1HTL0_ENDPU|nr:uncharacterized protein EPUS_05363 [Endocarpon pusillum Z07020]ERF73940.1 hypothetical protein EPUS_05363 [Endocarpon pusillum Z07020]
MSYLEKDVSGPVPVDDGQRAENAPIALPSDSGLHVHHGSDHDARQARGASALISPLYTVQPETSFPVVTDAPSGPLPKRAQRICGLRRRTFWILVILSSVVIVGAAVGGGVGGTMARRYADQIRTPSLITTPGIIITNTSSSTTSSIPTSSVQSSNTSIPPTPLASSSTNPRMEFSMQIWEEPAFGGRSQIFYAPGSYQTAFLARSYMWRPGQFDLDTMQVCSMAYCFGSNQLGWRGSTETEQPGFPQNASWGADNIVIACADSFLAPPCPGPLALSSFYTVPVIETATGDSAVPSSTTTSIL